MCVYNYVLTILVLRCISSRSVTRRRAVSICCWRYWLYLYSKYIPGRANTTNGRIKLDDVGARCGIFLLTLFNLFHSYALLSSIVRCEAIRLENSCFNWNFMTPVLEIILDCCFNSYSHATFYINVTLKYGRFYF